MTYYKKRDFIMETPHHKEFVENGLVKPKYMLRVKPARYELFPEPGFSYGAHESDTIFKFEGFIEDVKKVFFNRKRSSKKNRTGKNHCEHNRRNKLRRAKKNCRSGQQMKFWDCHCFKGRDNTSEIIDTLGDKTFDIFHDFEDDSLNAVWEGNKMVSVHVKAKVLPHSINAEPEKKSKSSQIAIQKKREDRSSFTNHDHICFRTIERNNLNRRRQVGPSFIVN